MEDPRIPELLECIDDVDEQGKPTKLALIAKRVQSYMEIVNKLRDELESYHREVVSLEERAENLHRTQDERSGLRGDITTMAGDAAIRAAFSATSSGAHLRKEAAEKQKGLQDFEKDFAAAEKHMKEVTRALDSRRERMLETRDQIARRMNIIDALLQRAEIEWPAYFFEENERLKSEARQSQPASHRRRRRGHRRVVRRKAG